MYFLFIFLTKDTPQKTKNTQNINILNFTHNTRIYQTTFSPTAEKDSEYPSRSQKVSSVSTSLGLGLQAWMSLGTITPHSLSHSPILVPRQKSALPQDKTSLPTIDPCPRNNAFLHHPTVQRNKQSSCIKTINYKIQNKNYWEFVLIDLQLRNLV